MRGNDIRRPVIELYRELLPLGDRTVEHQFAVGHHRRAVRTEESIPVAGIHAYGHFVGSHQFVSLLLFANAVLLFRPRSEGEIDNAVVGVTFRERHAGRLCRTDIRYLPALVFHPSLQCRRTYCEGTSEADDAVRPPRGDITPDEEITGRETAYTGDAGQFRFEFRGILPVGTGTHIGSLVRQRRTGYRRTRIARIPKDALFRETGIDDSSKPPFTSGTSAPVVTVSTAESSSSE